METTIMGLYGVQVLKCPRAEHPLRFSGKPSGLVRLVVHSEMGGPGNTFRQATGFVRTCEFCYTLITALSWPQASMRTT